MAEYLSEEDMNTGEYISRDLALRQLNATCLATDCDNYNGVRCRACAYADAMDFIDAIPAADVQSVNRWISVKDRLPDKFDYVLCYCKTTTGEGNVFMYGAYHKDTWWLKTCRTYATLEQPQMRVMYWMPLPEPPQD